MWRGRSASSAAHTGAHGARPPPPAPEAERRQQRQLRETYLCLTTTTTVGLAPTRHSSHPGWCRSSAALAVANNLSSIAFPAISCGIYGYPTDLAALVRTVGTAGCLLHRLSLSLLQCSSKDEQGHTISHQQKIPSFAGKNPRFFSSALATIIVTTALLPRSVGSSSHPPLSFHPSSLSRMLLLRLNMHAGRPHGSARVRSGPR